MKTIKFNLKQFTLFLGAVLLALSNMAFALQPFDNFINMLSKESDPAVQDRKVTAYIDKIIAKQGGLPLIEDKNKHDGVADAIFLYREAPGGTLSSFVLLFGEFNGVSPMFGPQFFFFRDFFNEEAMQKFEIEGYPPLFYRRLAGLEDAARLNYKFITSSFQFIFDPLNPKATPGGFGGDSTFEMPHYCAPLEFNYLDHGQHGTVLGAGGVPLVPKTGSPIGGDPSKDPNNRNNTLEPVNPIILEASMTGIFIGSPKRDQGYWVYLPPGYDENRTEGYPVAYVLDGADRINNTNINNIVDNLIQMNLIEPMILVLHDQQFCEDSDGGLFGIGLQRANCFGNNLVPGNPVNYDRVRDVENVVNAFEHPDTNEPVRAQEDFMLELIQEIDSIYNTAQAADKRVLIGTSSTAVSALNFPLKHPGAISKAIVLSGVHELLGWWCESENAGVNDPANNNPAVPPVYRLNCLTDGDVNTRDAALPLLPEASNVDVYVAWGTYETPAYDMVNFGAGTQTPMVTQNQDLVNQLTMRGNNVHWRNPAQGHSDALWSQAIGDGLRQLLPAPGADGSKTREELGLCVANP